jgi:hypothetical protein
MWKYCAIILLLLSCSPVYVVDIRQFGLSENIRVDGEITDVDTVWNKHGGVVKIVTFRRKQ